MAKWQNNVEAVDGWTSFISLLPSQQELHDHIHEIFKHSSREEMAEIFNLICKDTVFLKMYGRDASFVKESLNNLFLDNTQNFEKKSDFNGEATTPELSPAASDSDTDTDVTIEDVRLQDKAKFKNGQKVDIGSVYTDSESESLNSVNSDYRSCSGSNYTNVSSSRNVYPKEASSKETNLKPVLESTAIDVLESDVSEVEDDLQPSVLIESKNNSNGNPLQRNFRKSYLHNTTCFGTPESNVKPVPEKLLKPWRRIKNGPPKDDDSNTSECDISETLSINGERKRRRWTRTEEEALVRGVMKYGEGCWYLILTEGNFCNRRPQDLYDKYRNMKKYKHIDRIKERMLDED